MKRVKRWWPVLLVIILLLVGGCAAPGTPDGDVLHPDDDASPSDDDAPPPADTTPGGAVTPLVKPELAYLSGRDVWLLSPDGEQTRLTGWGDVEYFEWSPDGTRLACFRQAVAGMDSADLWVIHANGSGGFLLDSGVLYTNFAVTGAGFWHPNSRSLAYGLADQSTMRLKTLTGVVHDLAVSGHLSGGPWWHPGGEIIAYAVSGEPAQLVLRGRNDDFSRSLPFVANQRWFADGSGMVMAMYQVEEISGYPFFSELAVVNKKGEDYRVLYPAPAGGWAPLLKVSPVSRSVALGDYTTLHLVDGRTGVTSVLTGQDVMITYSEFSYPVRFAWSPGGDSLAALLYTQVAELGDGFIEGFWNLAVIDIPSGSMRTVWERAYEIGAGDFVQDVLPMNGWMELLTWSPDGKEILVLQSRAEGGFAIGRVGLDPPGAPGLYLENASYPSYRPKR
jgi:Tol biopolymer transport system component